MLTLSRGSYAIAGVVVVLLMAFAGRYGFHRDELYFIEGGHHPAWAQPDNPMLVPLLAAGWHDVTGGSLVLFRILPALAAAATVLIAAATSQTIGGSPLQQTLTAAVMASSSILLATGHLFSTTTFDLALTSATILLLLRALKRPEAIGQWIWTGVVAGMALEVKVLPGLVLFSCLVGIVVLGPRAVLRRSGPWLAMIIASVLAAPNLIWQARNGWPMMDIAANIAAGGSTSSSDRVLVVPMHLLLAGPLGAVVLVVGLVAPFRITTLRAYRWVPVAYLVMLILVVATGGKTYYLAGFFAVVFALGVGPLVALISRIRGGAVIAGAVAVVLITPTVFFALPVAPAGSRIFQIAVGVNPDQAETVGWDDLVAQVERTSAAVDRATSVVLARNYGEAGALSRARRQDRGAVPPVFSGHSGYGRWGSPPDSATDAVVVGQFSAAELDRWFAGCLEAGRYSSAPGVDNEENGAPIRICRNRLQRFNPGLRSGLRWSCSAKQI